MFPKAVYEAVAKTQSAAAVADGKVIEAQHAYDVAVAGSDKAKADATAAKRVAVAVFTVRPYYDASSNTIIFAANGDLLPYSPYLASDVVDVPPVDTDGDGEPDTLPTVE